MTVTVGSGVTDGAGSSGVSVGVISGVSDAAGRTITSISDTYLSVP